jgi:5'-3' exonuclease
MGINGFYTHLVKNFPRIISSFNSFKHNQSVTKGWRNVNLYLDSNSIIYDAYNECKQKFIDSKLSNDEIELAIIQFVIQRIDQYIETISPTNVVFIAFDGVAPMAKLNQQRSRRYKTNLFSKMQSENASVWNTGTITPGTSFMAMLTRDVSHHFNSAEKFGVNKLVVSGSNCIGEGEHKIYAFMRDYPKLHSDSTTIVYGLDSDLVMLSLCHLNICPNLFLFREAPHFIKFVNADFSSGESYVLNAGTFSEAIMAELCGAADGGGGHRTKMYDYVVLCFLLGNDFLPHFPALNIRTGGVDKLLDAYKSTLGKHPSECLFDGEDIQWNNLRMVVQYMANKEHDCLITEHAHRAKCEKCPIQKTGTEQEFMQAKTNLIPSYIRDDEQYINPSATYWEHRYYRALCGMQVSEGEKLRIKQLTPMCVNYLEGIEWTAKYYVRGCPDWRWSYQYHYPPLLGDLVHIIPRLPTSLISPNSSRPVCQMVQLCYVTPLDGLGLIPPHVRGALLKSGWYRNDYKLMWAYCKYLWESHVDMNAIDIDALENMVLLQPRV